jgi:hypothetical protein
VVGEAIRDQRAELALDLAVDLRDEIDRPLLLDDEIATAGHLHVSRADDGFDRRGEKSGWEGIRHWSPAS